MKLDRTEHFRGHWKVLELASDFRVWDVWEIPIQAEPGETFDDFCDFFIKSSQRLTTRRGLAGWLFRLRERLGRIFKWDENLNTLPIPGATETSLRDRLSAAERADAASVSPMGNVTFDWVYRTDREALLEISNDTCHAGLHLGWVERPNGRHVPQLAVYVKPRGLSGRLYLGLIAPFRHLIIYPAMMRQLSRGWTKRKRQSVSASSTVALNHV